MSEWPVEIKCLEKVVDELTAWDGPAADDPTHSIGFAVGEMHKVISMLAMSKWQPIATAPKDQTMIDLWVEPGGVAGSREPDCRWNTKRKYWETWGQTWCETMDWIKVEYTPTHWQPLPDPPETPADE